MNTQEANEAKAELNTIGDIIRWAASRFNEAELTYGHGTENALDEAYFIVSRALHLPFEFPQYMLSCMTTQAEREKIIQLISERINRRLPAAYLLKEAWFAGLCFYVDERVIVPRSPIAEMIETGFAPWINPDIVKSILDLCTGSGCIAIACAHAFPQAKVYASDVSTDALDVANRNIEKFKLQSSVRALRSDVLDALDSQLKYDVIVSNPPYVDREDMDMLPQEYQHEPELALTGGVDGLKVVKRILCGAADFLNPNGILVVEVGNSADALMQHFPQIPFMWPEFEKGGHGVFVLTREDLIEHQADLQLT